MIQWLQITSGRGPEECCWVVAQLLRRTLDEAAESGLKTHLLEAVPGDRAGTLRSALIAVDGNGASDFASEREGAVQWIGTSLFRPHHKRRNWYAGVESIACPDHPAWSERDIKIETMRSSGQGGQHVNKTESAVRATHLPTRLSAVAREERSQMLNRRLALARLARMLEEESERAADQAQKERWGVHNSLERGNPVRIYEGADFRLKS